MTKKVECQAKIKNRSESIRVRVIKAPLVDNADLNFVLTARSRALVL